MDTDHCKIRAIPFHHVPVVKICHFPGEDKLFFLSPPANISAAYPFRFFIFA
jgi:hypothetical protein